MARVYVGMRVRYPVIVGLCTKLFSSFGISIINSVVRYTLLGKYDCSGQGLSDLSLARVAAPPLSQCARGGESCYYIWPVK